MCDLGFELTLVSYMTHAINIFFFLKKLSNSEYISEFSINLG